MIIRINGQALSSWLKYQPSNVQSKAVEIAVGSQTRPLQYAQRPVKDNTMK